MLAEAMFALLVRATEPLATLTADTDHPLTSLWLAPIPFGSPWPAPPLGLRHLTIVAIRMLTALGLAVLATSP